MTRPSVVGVILAIVITGPLLARNDQDVVPGKQWSMVTPESQQVDSTKLARAIGYLEKHAGSNGVRRMVVVRNGRMIWKGPEAEVRQGVWSVTKAFTSTAQGLLIADGKCTLDTLAKDYNPSDLAKLYSTVTLRHFATMTSGYDGVGGSYDFAPGHRGDQNALVRPNQPFFKPGTKYMYWDEATQQYGYVLTRIAGEPLPDYLRRRILDPIGITQFRWKKDTTGKALNWTGGIEISAADLARFGLLYLHRGDWAGKQLIDSEWIDEATRVQVPATIPDALATSSRKGSGVYGFHWWPNGRRPDGRRNWPNAPASTFCRSGYNNNDLFIIPDWNMVIVRLGLDQSEDELTRAEYNVFLGMVSDALRGPIIEGRRRVWQTLTVTYRGPQADQADTKPNPFLDYRLTVAFKGPRGHTYRVPGFFDGDGRGGGTGNVWRVRFTPDLPGDWSYQASFRKGPSVSISRTPNAGTPVVFDGTGGRFQVRPADRHGSAFERWGRLAYNGTYYLKFQDGPYWIRGGTDSPENLLAYAGFTNTVPSHKYAAHREDWRPGDPDWGNGRGRAIIGALNYLAAKHVNSVYFLTTNIGGDGGDVWPWCGSPNPQGSPKNDNLHFDLAKLRQWNAVFTHAQQQGVFLHFVLNEGERANKCELDDGELGTERKLYYRELVARFAHHLALEWNLCEEYNLNFDLGPGRIRAFADFIRDIDPYGHPVTVHSAGDPLKALRFTFGDERFSLTSIQLGQSDIGALTEKFRRATAAAGRQLPISMDEFTLDARQQKSWIPVNDADRWRTEKLWPTYLSGGNIEFILADRLQTDSFKTPELANLWDYVWYARSFVQQLPYWEMKPADELVTGAAAITITRHRGSAADQIGAQVFAKPGTVYAVYYPTATATGHIDLSSAHAPLTQRWYNPRTGDFVGPTKTLQPDKAVTIGMPPRSPKSDWVALLRVVSASTR